MVIAIRKVRGTGLRNLKEKNGAFPGSKFSGEYTVNPVKKKRSIARRFTENPQKNSKLTVDI